MSGSSFGNIFRITTWGESHGNGIGVVIDGCPAGMELSPDDIQAALDKRKPGQNRFSTPRKENDTAEILSGVFEGKTTGCPIAILVRNEQQRSSDYSKLADCYRPGHADFTFDEKYGFRDYRGGGRSSGRETIGRVAAGAVAKKLLEGLGIKVLAYSSAVAGISARTFDEAEIERNPFRVPDAKAAEEIAGAVSKCMTEADSAGGIAECVAYGLPAGLGEPVFEKLDANLAKALMSIGAVKGVEIGDGFAAAAARGSENNDGFCIKDGKPEKLSNHSGGVLGGISDGSRLVVRAAFKPTPSISQTQKTVNRYGDEIDLSIGGRHDPLVVPRAVPVVEAMVCLVLADAVLMNMSSRFDRIRDFYSR